MFLLSPSWVCWWPRFTTPTCTGSTWVNPPPPIRGQLLLHQGRRCCVPDADRPLAMRSRAAERTTRCPAACTVAW